MRRDAPWTPLEVFATGLGAVIAVGLVRLATALIEWWTR
jgi:hypothetical protein